MLRFAVCLPSTRLFTRALFSSSSMNDMASDFFEDSGDMEDKKIQEKEARDKVLKDIHGLRSAEAKDIGLFVDAAEIDMSPLRKNPKMVVPRKVDELGRSWGTGRRKTSTASAVLEPGTGLMWINKRPVYEYFGRIPHRFAVVSPFQATLTAGMYDCHVQTKGGGLTGQAEATRLAISRALQNHDPILRNVLRDGVFLTRDRRAVERKKPGKKKARKSFQYPKR